MIKVLILVWMFNIYHLIRFHNKHYLQVSMNIKTCLTFLVFALFVTGCAREGAPPGGPKDTRPPEMVASFPENGSINVDINTEFYIIFDENVNRNTLTAAFSLSPPPQGSVKVKWKGKQVNFLFDPPLLDDKTYVLSLGTSLTDSYGNPILEPINIAISTGDKLDKGFVEGNLYTEGSTSGWNIIAYMLEDLQSDSSMVTDPDPSTQVPDATTQVNADGRWSLSNLKTGRWRAFAFKDLDGDRLWTPWSEKLAVPPYDLTTSEDSLFIPRAISLVAFDRPYFINIMGVSARIRNILNVKFDRVLKQNDGHYSIEKTKDSMFEEIDKEEYEIVDNRDIDVNNISFKPGDSTVVQLLLSDQLKGDISALRIQGKFGFEELMDTTMSVFTKQSADVDSIPPEIIYIAPEEGARFHPGKSEFEIVFNEKLGRLDTNVFRYTNSLDDTLFLIPDQKSNILKFKLSEETESCRFNIELFGGNILDIAGNSLQDSLPRYSYSFIPFDSLGSVSGAIISESERCKYRIRLKSLNPKDIDMEIVTLRQGPFQIENIPAGNWVLESWQYRKNLNEWDIGTAVPFKPSDNYTVVKDTINVRARWESGGIEVIFP
jgi:Bacterial Ig-like domain